MKNIWIFGDSYSDEFSEKHDWAKKYIDYKGYKPKNFGDFINDKSEYKVFNRAKNGSSNYSILDEIRDNLKNFQKGDIAIIGWTDNVRTRLINNLSFWHDVLPHCTEALVNKFDNISMKTLEEILVNRDNDATIIEIDSWILFFKLNFKNYTFINWSPFDVNYKFLDYSMPLDLETIKQETKGQVSDNHFSENAHLKLSEDFIIQINNLKKKIF